MVSKTRHNYKKKRALRLKKSRRHRLRKSIGGGRDEFDAYINFLQGHHEPNYNKHVFTLGKNQPAAPYNGPYPNSIKTSEKYETLWGALSDQDKEQINRRFDTEVGYRIDVYVPPNPEDPSIIVQPIFYAEQYMAALSQASGKNLNEIFKILSTGGKKTLEEKEIIKLAFGNAHDYIHLDLEGATTYIKAKYINLVSTLP